MINDMSRTVASKTITMEQRGPPFPNTLNVLELLQSMTKFVLRSLALLQS